MLIRLKFTWQGQGFLEKVTCKLRWKGLILSKNFFFSFQAERKICKAPNARELTRLGVGATAVLCWLWERIPCSIIVALSSRTGCLLLLVTRLADCFGWEPQMICFGMLT